MAAARRRHFLHAIARYEGRPDISLPATYFILRFSTTSSLFAIFAAIRPCLDPPPLPRVAADIRDIIDMRRVHDSTRKDIARYRQPGCRAVFAAARHHIRHQRAAAATSPRPCFFEAAFAMLSSPLSLSHFTPHHAEPRQRLLRQPRLYDIAFTRYAAPRRAAASRIMTWLRRT